MAAALLLRQGRAGALRTMLLEARVFRGFAATVPLSAESGKSEKGLPPTPRKQGAPKNVVEPQEGPELPARQMAAAPRAHPSAGRTGGGAHGLLSGKTLVEFPQKAPFPSRERRSDPAVTREGRRVADGSSSSSSSSSSSDSESDEEGDRPGARPRGKSKGRGRPPKAQASTENARAQEPHTGVAHPPRKNGIPAKPWEDTGEAKPKATARKPEAGAELVWRDAAGKQVPRAVRSADADRGSQKPCDGKDVSSDPAEPGLSAPTTAQAGPGGQLQAAPPGAQESHRERAPGPSRKAASLPMRKESVGGQPTAGQVTATGEVLGDREPPGSMKTIPVDGEDVCEEAGGVTEAASALAPREDAAQEPALAPAEPSDSTTYKNLQHHDYTPYTFLDLNLDLSKFRMPQPSSGRESPRH
ncbi:NADH dehydrogenase [ubiquinone] flavoprotein 3, mitochondrial isoform X1 [Lepus europaeus]|uniref:NADH dehydrogenase [ubiquinone] flavoprotein 3, mitochondrial isoform X1 n=1 Tax=Lepus europaeus TaxID=9983 RepID=UPI002B490B81|nr:NADH dehydrogenase [ubiquinone] flavoprotein 3, mitochondrial isoform X1 [Lepus europaeus]